MINNKNVRLRSCILIKLTMFSTESWVRLYKVSPVKWLEKSIELMLWKWHRHLSIHSRGSLGFRWTSHIHSFSQHSVIISVTFEWSNL